ncbi:MAG: SDR family oxidoreductase [Spirochaetes bacterium]|nr:SDR family oxidoreductase [Spirochaetota bacterium]
MLLKNKVAIVTGSSQGIGAAISLELAKEGADICLVDLKFNDKSQEFADRISETGRKCISVKCDVSSFNDAETAVAKAVEEFGTVDILVNNAGISLDGVSWKMSEEQWDRVLSVNLKGCFNFSRHAIPVMKEKKYGKIINITSINGIRGKFGQSNYSASKAGVIGYTKALAKELGAFSINVNAVAPGLIETSMLSESEDREKIINMAMNEIVMKRVGLPEDLAYMVAFLASEKARHVTGEVIKVDGGQYI